MAEKKTKSRGRTAPRPVPEPPARASGRTIALLVVAAIAVLVYVSTLGHAFAYDDQVILKNSRMHDPWSLVAIFGSDFYGGTHAHVDLYRPLTAWSFALNWWTNELFGAQGASPFVFHATNVLLHAAVSVLVLLFVEALGLSRMAAIAAAVLFAVHPLHTEAVANVYARSEILAALFGLVFLIFYRRGRSVPAAIAFFCALASKESALAFWPVAVALDLWMPTGSKRARPAMLAAVALGVWFLLRTSALSKGADHAEDTFVENPLIALSASERWLSALKVQLLALRLLILPIGLSSDYSFDEIQPATGFTDPAVLGLLALLATAGAIAWILRRTRPEVGASVIGYVLLWIPASNLLFPIGTIFGERLAYAPSIFGCLLAASVLELIGARVHRRFFVIAAGTLALVGAVMILARNPVWKNDLTLFYDQTQTAPRSAKAHFNFGTVLARIGERRAAVDSFERAVRIHGLYAPAHFALANELYHLGDDLPRTEQTYRRAIRADPEFLDARVNLALTLLRLSRTDEAGALIEEVRRLYSRHPSLPALDRQLQEARAAKPAAGDGR